MHRPDMPEVYDADLANLATWLDLACFIGEFGRVSASERGKGDLHNDIPGCIREIEKTWHYRPVRSDERSTTGHSRLESRRHIRDTHAFRSPCIEAQARLC